MLVVRLHDVILLTNAAADPAGNPNVFNTLYPPFNAVLNVKYPYGWLIVMDEVPSTKYAPLIGATTIRLVDDAKPSLSRTVTIRPAVLTLFR